jgi:hypothetical protein
MTTARSRTIHLRDLGLLPTSEQHRFLDLQGAGTAHRVLGRATHAHHAARLAALAAECLWHGQRPRMQANHIPFDAWATPSSSIRIRP